MFQLLHLRFSVIKQLYVRLRRPRGDLNPGPGAAGVAAVLRRDRQDRRQIRCGPRAGAIPEARRANPNHTANVSELVLGGIEAEFRT